MTGCGNCSKKLHWEVQNAKELGFVLNEIIAQVDAEQTGKIVQKKINELENDKQSTCHSNDTT